MGQRYAVPVIRRKDYQIFVEQWDDISIGHCDVYRWNREVSRKIREDVDAFLKLHGGPIYVLGRADPRHLKFITVLGFTPHPCGLVEHEGHSWPLYIKE